MGSAEGEAGEIQDGHGEGKRVTRLERGPGEEGNFSRHSRSVSQRHLCPGVAGMPLEGGGDLGLVRRWSGAELAAPRAFVILELFRSAILRKRGSGASQLAPSCPQTSPARPIFLCCLWHGLKDLLRFCFAFNPPRAELSGSPAWGGRGGGAAPTSRVPGATLQVCFKAQIPPATSLPWKMPPAFCCRQSLLLPPPWGCGRHPAWAPPGDGDQPLASPWPHHQTRRHRGRGSPWVLSLSKAGFWAGRWPGEIPIPPIAPLPLLLDTSF